MAKIKLSMPTLLPLVWAAYEAGELQAQTTKYAGGGALCRYDGPCAIGVGIPETQRARLDRSDYPEIGGLIRAGTITIPDAESVSDYSKLQVSHDNWVHTAARGMGSEGIKEAFIHTLVSLSKKYGVEIPNGFSDL